MKILIACEHSGVLRREFRARGHEAFSCDLAPAEDGGEHLLGDVFGYLDRDWDLMICHPPCTYLTASAEWCYKDGPYHQKINPEKLYGAARRAAREEAIAFAERLMNAKIPRIATENPIGALNTRVRKPDQIVQPFQFGDNASKSTCLWLKNLPTLAPTEFIHPRMICKICGGRSEYHHAHKVGCIHCGAEPAMLRPRWANQTDSGQNKLGPSEQRAIARSRTYPGIARAMAEQWGAISA